MRERLARIRDWVRRANLDRRADVTHDVRYAVRTLRRPPGFTGRSVIGLKSIVGFPTTYPFMTRAGLEPATYGLEERMLIRCLASLNIGESRREHPVAAGGDRRSSVRTVPDRRV